MSYDFSSILNVLFFTLGYLVGPFLLVVGSVFAYSISLDPKCAMWAKAAGWVFGLPVSIMVGTVLLPILLPSFVDSFFMPVGIAFLAGYGWIGVWLTVINYGRDDHGSKNPRRHIRNGDVTETKTQIDHPAKKQRSSASKYGIKDSPSTGRWEW